jgi:hypothetical protein
MTNEKMSKQQIETALLTIGFIMAVVGIFAIQSKIMAVKYLLSGIVLGCLSILIILLLLYRRHIQKLSE